MTHVRMKRKFKQRWKSDAGTSGGRRLSLETALSKGKEKGNIKEQGRQLAGCRRGEEGRTVKIDYFREFVVLAEYLNFSAAAEHLFITQPVLSRHMAALEEDLGVRLLDRNTQEVRLTPAGKLFHKRILKILLDYDDLRQMLRLQREGYESRLCVGVPYYAISDYLGDIPEAFEGKYPRVKLTYEVGSPDAILSYVEQDRVDVALLPHLTFPRGSTLEFRDFYIEQLGVLISSGDPLAKKESCKLVDLKKHTFFQIGGTYFSSTWEQLRYLCRRRGFEPTQSNMSLMESAIIGVRRGDGIVVAGHHMRGQASNGVSYLRLEDEDCVRNISICYKAANRNRDTIRKFAGMFEKLIQK